MGKEEWWKSMIEQHGSKKAVSDFMRKNQQKSRKSGTFKQGGFAYLKQNDPKRLSKISKKASNSRWNQKK